MQKKINKFAPTRIRCCLIFLLLFLSCQEVGAFSQPIVQKAQQAQQHLIVIGKAIAGLSIVVAIILFLLGKPQWKWFGYIIVGGALLTGISPVIQWIVN